MRDLARCGWVAQRRTRSPSQVWNLSASSLPPKPTYTLCTAFPTRCVHRHPEYPCKLAIVSSGEFGSAVGEVSNGVVTTITSSRAVTSGEKPEASTLGAGATVGDAVGRVTGPSLSFPQSLEIPPRHRKQILRLPTATRCGRSTPLALLPSSIYASQFDPSTPSRVLRSHGIHQAASHLRATNRRNGSCHTTTCTSPPFLWLSSFHAGNG